MKNFKFSLDSVLRIKEQLLNALQKQYSNILCEYKTQEEYIAELHREFDAKDKEFKNKNASGMTILDMVVYKNYFDKQLSKIKYEEDKLAEINERLEDKRVEVVDINKEITSIQKLREQKLNEHNTKIKKSEELFIEEFVSSRM